MNQPLSDQEIRTAPDLVDADWSMVPAHMREPLCDYLLHHRSVGHFLTAVLSNDLLAAASRADAMNRVFLAEYPIFLFNYAPPAAYGSPEKVAAWLAAAPAVPQ